MRKHAVKLRATSPAVPPRTAGKFEAAVSGAQWASSAGPARSALQALALPLPLAGSRDAGCDDFRRLPGAAAVSACGRRRALDLQVDAVEERDR